MDLSDDFWRDRPEVQDVNLGVRNPIGRVRRIKSDGVSDQSQGSVGRDGDIGGWAEHGIGEIEVEDLWGKRGEIENGKSIRRSPWDEASSAGGEIDFVFVSAEEKLPLTEGYKGEYGGGKERGWYG
jgi:hypothetical protein